MAVFSKISKLYLSELLKNYNLGRLVSFEGIKEGIENTNYFIYTTKGDYVLTIFEKLTFSQVPFYLYFMRHLAKKRTPCPLPILNNKKQILITCNDKPATIVSRLDGKTIKVADPEHCFQIGRALAVTHQDAMDFPEKKPNPRGLLWLENTVTKILKYLDLEQKDIIVSELINQQKFFNSKLYSSLPKAIIHGDLFRDNALFIKDKKNSNKNCNSDKLGGIIDFYFAGFDCLIFDLAVCINDWAISEDEENYGKFIPSKYEALLKGYESIRSLTINEKEAWQMHLRAAALRFWMSRIYDWFEPRNASLLTPKDPKSFEKILLNRQNEMELNS